MPRKGPFPVRDYTKVFNSWDDKYLFIQMVFYAPPMTVHFRRKKIPDPHRNQSDEKKIKIVKCSVPNLSRQEQRRIFGEAKHVFDKEDERRTHEEVCPSFPGMEPPSLKERRRLIAEEERRAPRIRVK